MTRHIYTVIIDCPERAADVSAACGRFADEMLNTASGTRTVTMSLVVPHDDGVGLMPTIKLEEVSRRAAPDPG